MRETPPRTPARKPETVATKAERLAAALKLNLSRRKAQQRARAVEQTAPQNRD